MLISDTYREMNRQLHQSNPDYGTSGHKWADLVWQLAHQYKVGSVLDWGCGRQTLHKKLLQEEHAYRFRSHYCCKAHGWLHEGWTNYDPAIEGLDGAPSPADLVVCGDVLEHIEPECLSDVLDELQRLTNKAVVLVIATRPAKKTLPDGRNAHLIQEPISWWMGHLMNRWTVRQLQNLGGEFVFIGEPLKVNEAKVAA